MILPEYPDAASLVRRMKEGPYPIDLEFYDSKTLSSGAGAATTAGGASNDDYRVTTISRAKDDCRLKSRRDDLLEINYEAGYLPDRGDPYKVFVYDSSERRGTGRPYQYVLGSGDLLPGVDLGLYDMCVGEVREIEIPPNGLGYGDRGNKLFRIPGGVRLRWTVELVAIDYRDALEVN